MKGVAILLHRLNALYACIFDLFNIQLALAAHADNVALFAVNPALF